MQQRFASRIANCRAAVTLAAACAVVTAAGCASSVDSPELHPAKGRVLKADGSPVTSGLIIFRSEEHPNYTTNAAIGEDGTFSLETMVAEGKFPGAGAGPHMVVIMPLYGGDQTQQDNEPQPIMLREKYTVEPGGENNFTIRLP